MKKIIFAPLLIISLSACNPGTPKKKHSSSSEPIISSHSDIPTSIYSSEQTTTILSSDITTQVTSKTVLTSQIRTSSTTTKTTTITTTTSSSDDPYFDDKEKLSCGYYTTDVPTSTPFNLVTSYDAKDWVNYDTTNSLPTNFIYIYKNAYSGGPKYHTTTPDFYHDDYGGIKVSNQGIGFQTPRFYHSGEKIELRIKIGGVNNATDKPAKDKPTGYVYCYDVSGKHLSNLDYSIPTGTITKSSEGGEIKIYLIGSHIEDVSYVEFRLNEKPFKGDQCYNFGITGVGLKSWTKA